MPIELLNVRFWGKARDLMLEATDSRALPSFAR
jgi:hypothetical protein